jgi:hypothetical protein
LFALLFLVFWSFPSPLPLCWLGPLFSLFLLWGGFLSQLSRWAHFFSWWQEWGHHDVPCFWCGALFVMVWHVSSLVALSSILGFFF